MHAIEYQTAYAWFLLLLSITPTALLLLLVHRTFPGFFADLTSTRIPHCPASISSR